MSELREVTTIFLRLHRDELERDRLQAMSLPTHAVVHRNFEPDPEQYRALYLGVGARWLWYERAELPADKLAKEIDAPDVQVHLLESDGKEAGYSETKRRGSTMHIAYFGLLPQFIGHRMGQPFLAWTVLEAFAEGIEYCRLHTCTLDHPKALSTYQSVGFREERRESGHVRIPESALRRARTPEQMR